MKKIIIVEDNKRDFLKMLAFLQEEFPEIEVYPKTEEENKILKKNIKQYFSPAPLKKEAAEDFLNNINFDSYDGIILDYVLDSSFQGVNGISLYNSLNLNAKALILTKLTAVEFKNIERNIKSLSLEKKITAIQKGTNIKLTNDQKKEYRKMINSHFYNLIEQNDLPIIVILTALQQEYSAVRQHLIDLKNVEVEGFYYEEGVFAKNGLGIAKVIIREGGAKIAVAAQETERAITKFKPKCMFFVGIAGSRKPNDFKIGDVVIAEKVYSYEGAKATEDTFKARPEAETLTTSIIEIAKRERRDNAWREFIIGDFDELPNANIGIIASGNQLVDDLNSDLGKILDIHYNDTSAVEMEGYSFAMTAKRQAGTNIEIGIIRGISDIIKSDNDNILSTDRRPEHTKKLASSVAAAFTFWIILKKLQN